MKRAFTEIRQLYRGRRWFRVLTRAAFGLCALFLVAWLVLEFWIVPKLIEQANHEMAKVGVHLTHEEFDIALLSGRVDVEDATLYQSAERERPVLHLSNLTVTVGVWDLVFGGKFLADGKVNNGKVVVFGEGVETRFDDFDAVLGIDAEHISILSAEAQASFGHEVTLTGEIRWADGNSGGGDEATDTDTEEGGEHPEFPAELAWMHVVGDILRFTEKGDLGRLDLHLIWDKTLPETVDENGDPIPVSQLVVDGKVTAEDVVWHNVPLEEFDGSFRFENWGVKIPGLKLTGLGGEFDVKGDYLIGTNQLLVSESRLTMDPSRLLDYLGFDLADEISKVEFSINPTFTGEDLVIDFSDLEKSEFAVNFVDSDGFQYRTGDGENEVIDIDSFRCQLRYSQVGELSFQEIALRSNGLDALGRVVLRPNPESPKPDPSLVKGEPEGGGESAGGGVGSDGEVEKGVSPVAGLFNRFLTFSSGASGELPRLEFDVLWDESREPSSRLELKGSFLGEDFVWKDRAMELVDIEFEFKDERLGIGRMSVIGPSGELNASASYDLRRQLLTVPSAESTVDIAAIKRTLEVEFPEPFDTLEFRTPPHISADDFEVKLGDSPSGKGQFGLVADQGFSLKGSGEDVLEVENFEVSLLWRGEKELEAERISGRVRDLEIFGKGDFRWDASLEEVEGEIGEGRQGVAEGGDEVAKSESNGWEAKEALSWVGFVDRVLRFETDGEALPKLAFNVSWDETKPEGLRVAAAANFAGAGFNWHDRPIEIAEFGVSYIDGKIRGDRIQFRGIGGEMATAGVYDLTTNTLSIPSFQSTINFGVLEEKLEIDYGRLIDRVRFPSPPSVTATDLEIEFGDTLSGKGRVDMMAADGLTLIEGEEELTLERLEVAVSWGEPQILQLERVVGKIGGLDFATAGVIRWEDRDSENSGADEGVREENGEGEDEEVVVVAEPMLLPTLREYLTVEADGNPVQLTGAFTWDESRRGPGSEWFDLLELEGKISGGRSRWRGADFTQTRAQFTLSDGVLTARDFLMQSARGKVETNADFDFRDMRLHMAPLTLTLDPVTALERLGLPIKNGSNDWIHFLGSPVIRSNDVAFDLDEIEKSSGALELRVPNGIELTTGKGRKAQLEEVSGLLTLNRGELSGENFQAKLFGGSLRIDFKSALAPGKPYLELGFDVSDVSVPAFNVWINPENQIADSGSFDLHFEGAAAGDLASLKGSGFINAGAENASTQGMMVIGGLIDFLERLVPFLSRKKEWSAHLPFEISDGVATIKKAKLTGPSVTVDVNGEIDWINDKVDVRAGVDLRGLIGVVGVVLTPFRSHFIGVRGTGTTGDVEWEMTRDASE